MKILVFSDSHRDISLISHVLRKTEASIKTVFHLGDCISDVVRLEQLFPEHRFFCVRGNSDYSSEDGANELIVPVMGKKIMLTHGHKYDVYFSYQRITYAAEEKQVDACLFGHTHKPVMYDCEAVFFMNPGSTSQPRGQIGPSYGVLDISESGVITGSIVERHKRGFRPVDL